MDNVKNQAARHKKRMQYVADFITRQLEAGKEVRIPGFGKFYTSTVVTAGDHPMAEDWGGYDHVQQQVRFRAWKGLKDKVKRKNKICIVSGSYRYNTSLCHHPDGEGHEGLHMDWRGKRFEVNDKGRIVYLDEKSASVGT